MRGCCVCAGGGDGQGPRGHPLRAPPGPSVDPVLAQQGRKGDGLQDGADHPGRRPEEKAPHGAHGTRRRTL